MRRWNIYTPEGVQDILFESCTKRVLESKIRKAFKLNGYKRSSPYHRVLRHFWGKEA